MNHGVVYMPISREGDRNLQSEKGRIAHLFSRAVSLSTMEFLRCSALTGSAPT